MKKFIVALDQGTSSSRAIVFDKSGKSVAVSQREFTQYFPEPGWVEHNPMEIWSSEYGVLAEVLTLEVRSTMPVERHILPVWQWVSGPGSMNSAGSGRPTAPSLLNQTRRKSKC